nr:hypothetical protein [Tanacetum cinerariifolium]
MSQYILFNRHVVRITNNTTFLQAYQHREPQIGCHSLFIQELTIYLFHLQEECMSNLMPYGSMSGSVDDGLLHILLLEAF